jgi:hypothetical protein
MTLATCTQSGQKFEFCPLIDLYLEGKTVLLLVLSTTGSHKMVKIFLNNHFIIQTQ